MRSSSTVRSSGLTAPVVSMKDWTSVLITSCPWRSAAMGPNFSRIFFTRVSVRTWVQGDKVEPHLRMDAWSWSPD